MRAAPIQGNNIIRADHVSYDPDASASYNSQAKVPASGVAAARPLLRRSILQVSGHGTSTFVALLMRSEQIEEERPVAYVGGWMTALFPPDLVQIGVRLERLLMVRPPSFSDCIWAVDTLVRSGQFGLVVFEAPTRPRISLGAINRLSHLVRRHGSTLVIATEEAQPLLASAVAVHGEITMEMVRDDMWRLVLKTRRNRISLPPIVEDIYDNGCMCPDTGLQAADRRSAS